ncbi:AraC-like transcriptional regulator QhpR [Muricoccus pecuniae]|uniref:AraC-like DNA-binding protein n=1 Tax=Muricoccus pecuniae TaxID=693023 RepID=A0A840YNF1_9PROT|nr:AraC family transcriptional regulator [Roseomonas pecuniae]MBB5696494.1 AraC-like DNA-binding protein [Roseomonas pecuniae]
MLSAPPAISTVLAATTTGLEDFIRRLGGDAEGVLERAGLGCGQAARPNSPIRLDRYCLAMDHAAVATGNDNFGLWFGQQFAPQSLGLWGYLGCASSDLGTALANMAAAFPLHQANSLFALKRQDGLAVLRYAVCDPRITRRRHDAELSLGMFRNLLRVALGPRWAPLEVHFAHPRPEGWMEHREAFGAETLFEQHHNALVFDASLLATPMPQGDAMLLNVVRHSLEQLRAQGPVPPATLGERAKLVVETLLPDGYPRLEEVARALDQPSWTFQRRLAQEATTFKDLVEAVRMEAAPRHLAAGQLTVSEVAFRLGYSEISAFSRAFSRWYGMPPRQWRRQAG